MLTLGCDTFGLSALILPKRTIAAYCGVRLEADALTLLLRGRETGAPAVRVPPLECNLPLLLTLPLQSGESSLAQVIRGAFTRRKLPRQGFVERLEALVRQEEERFGTYITPLLGRLKADLERKAREVPACIARHLLSHGFDALDLALGRLVEETAHLVDERSPLALLHAQLETGLTLQMRELEQAKRRSRTGLARLVAPLRARHRSRAVRLAQEITLAKLTLLLCRLVWQEDPLLRHGTAQFEGQRTRLQTVRDSLLQRVQELARARHELATRDEVLERAGRGLCLTEALKAHGQSLEDYYRRAALSPEALARDVATHIATADPMAVLAFVQAEAMRQGQRAVASLSLLEALGQLAPTLRRQLLSACVQAADVQMRIDHAVYAAREFLPVMTRACIVPGGPESPLATWLQDIVAEPWDFVHRDADEEILFLTTGHRILPEALIGHRLLKDVYERFPRKEWVQVLHTTGDVAETQLPLLPSS